MWLFDNRFMNVSTNRINREWHSRQFSRMMLREVTAGLLTPEHPIACDHCVKLQKNSMRQQSFLQRIHLLPVLSSSEHRTKCFSLPGDTTVLVRDIMISQAICLQDPRGKRSPYSCRPGDHSSYNYEAASGEEIDDDELVWALLILLLLQYFD